MKSYDIKIYESGREKETIRNLSYAQMIVISQILDRKEIQYVVKANR
jgi:hypothetical protein